MVGGCTPDNKGGVGGLIRVVGGRGRWEVGGRGCLGG